MQIIVEKNQDESQTPIVTIDLKTCYYPYAIRNALELALELDGYDASTIKEVFNQMPDTKCEPSPDLERQTGSYTTEEQIRVAIAMRSANCYNELKAFLQEKKKSPRLCAWDSVHHQEIWDKMLELEKKYSGDM